MEVRSIYKTARVSPKKARDVAREIQGLPVSEALDALTFTPRKAAFLIGKTLKSAIANAENNHDLAVDTLVVKEANVSSGPSFRRFKPRARGSASAILKRTSHIAIILSDEITIEEKPQRKKSTTKKAAAKKPAAAKEEKAPEPEEEIEETPVAEEASEPEQVEETPAAEAAAEEEEKDA